MPVHKNLFVLEQIDLFNVDHVSIGFLFVFALMEGKYACENQNGYLTFFKS